MKYLQAYRLQAVKGASAAPQIRHLEIIQMDPRIGAVFGASYDGTRLMHCSNVLLRGIFAQGARP